MFRKTTDHKQTASIHNGIVTKMYDDGFDNMLDCRVTFGSDSQARACLEAEGFEEFDPNASLKAMGMVFINGIYRMPEGAR